MRVVVVGLGVMGLPTARALAERGHDVVGLDRFAVGAPAGSSAGDSRIFRFSHTDRELIRLAVRALESWRGLEARAGEQLILMRGLLERGDPARASARALDAEGVEYRELSTQDASALFPELTPRPDAPAIFHPDAGTIRADRALQAELELARASGAEIVEGERVVAVEPRDDGVRLVTERRALEADVAAVCAGPWMEQLLGPLDLLPPLTPVPAQVTYFDSSAPTYERPCFVDWRAEIEECLYGMPTARGYKLGFLETTKSWDPEGGEIPVSDEEVELLAALVRRVLPGLAAPAGSQTCPVTLAADGKFILDRRGQLVLGAGCSGQAFKFMPLLGELLADLVEERPRDPLLEQFRLDRPGLERPVSSIRDLLLHDT